MKTLPLSLVLVLVLSASALAAADWTSSGPRGGFITSLAVGPDPRIVYATGYGSIFRTDDNGATWRDVTNGLGAAPLIVVDPSDADTAYVIGAGDVRPTYRTNDGGATWTAMNTGLKRMTMIAVDPNDPRTLYASADCGQYLEPLFDGAGIAKSTDGGRTWSKAMAGIDAGFGSCISHLSLDPARASHLFATAYYSGGPWESFDGGATWTRTSGSVPSREIVIDPYQPDVRYGTNGRQALRSDDGGFHWTPQAAAGIPNVPTPAFQLADLSLDPVTPRLFSATVAGLFRSGDGGNSWVLAGDVPRIRVNAVHFNPDAQTVMIGTSQGVFRAPSPAFTPWTRLDVPESGIPRIQEIATDPRNSSIVYASTGDEYSGMRQGRVFRSRDAGASWEQVSGPFDNGARLTVDAGGDLFFAAFDGTTVKRVPSGTNDVIALSRTFSPIRTIAAHPSIPGRVFAGSMNGQILRTSDGGATWTACQGVAGNLEQLALDASSDTIFAATLRGMYRSTDGCATFQRLDQSTARAVAVAPSNPSVVYRCASDFTVSSKRLIWRSDDRGTTWTPAAPLPFMSEPFAFIDAEWIVVDPRNAHHLWVADRGVWESTDGGASWHDVSGGLPLKAANGLAIDRSGSILHAGVPSHGVWELRLHPRGRAVRPR